MWFNTITIISITSIKNQIDNIKKMSPQTDVSKRNKLIKRLYGNLVVKNISLVAILASSIAMLLTSSLALSIFTVISILLKMFISSIMFLVLN